MQTVQGSVDSQTPGGPGPTGSRWRNRIVGTGSEPPERLVANPLNWRIHPPRQHAALAGALASVGWVQQVVVNRRTGFVVDGHLRVALADAGRGGQWIVVWAWPHQTWRADGSAVSYRQTDQFATPTDFAMKVSWRVEVIPGPMPAKSAENPSRVELVQPGVQPWKSAWASRSFTWRVVPGLVAEPVLVTATLAMIGSPTLTSELKVALETASDQAVPAVLPAGAVEPAPEGAVQPVTVATPRNIAARIVSTRSIDRPSRLHARLPRSWCHV